MRFQALIVAIASTSPELPIVVLPRSLFPDIVGDRVGAICQPGGPDRLRQFGWPT
jgi:hypothetical protein